MNLRNIWYLAARDHETESGPAIVKMMGAALVRYRRADVVVPGLVGV